MFRTFAWLAAAGAALCLSTAAALGLGEIEVKSKLNQSLVAVIPMTSVSPDEAEGVTVSLANNDDFARAGIERSEYVATLRFAVSTDGGNPRILVTSKQTAREPYLSFLIEVRNKAGRSLREYTVLLDPPDMQEPAAVKAAAPAKPEAKPATAAQFYETPDEQQRKPTPAAPVQAPAPAPAPVAAAPVEAPAPVETIPPPAAESVAAPSVAAVSSPGTYGPVQPKETLWGIATKVRPNPGVSMDQVLLALYKNNPKSFAGYPDLLKGATLNVPTAEQMHAVSPAAAKERVAELRGAPAPAKVAPALVPEVVTPPPAAAAPVVPPPAPAPVPKIKPKAESPLVPPPAAKVEPLVPPAPKTMDKPLVPPPAMPEKKIEPKVEPLVPPPAAKVEPLVPPPATATTPPPAAAVASDQPLIPPPAAEPVVVPPPAVPVIAEPQSNNSGLYLWLGVGVILLGAGGFLGYRYWKSQDGDSGAEGEKKSFIPSAKFKKDAVPAAFAGLPKATAEDIEAAQMAATQTSAPAKGEVDRMQDTMADTRPVSRTSTQNFDSTSTSESPASRFEATMAMSTGQTPSYNATQSMDAATRTGNSVAPSDHVDFDVTSQFAAETMSINLDANDPVSEADFHLAYGLYDEAALLLKQAADKDPSRTDVRVKLAETYFAASRPAEFQQVAESLHGHLPEADWQKLAIMGRQLCPDSHLFAGADDSALGGDIDLAFDEPSTPAAASSAHNDDAMDLGGLDFKLEELELPKIEEPMLDFPTSAPASAPASGGSSGNTLDFKLDNIDFNATSPGTSVAFTPSPATAPKPDQNMETIAMSTQSELSEVKLDDFDLNDASTAISAGDEAGTKLDLARAYADMGDNDMARTLLKEVATQGNPAQQREAQTLMGRLA